MYTYYTFNFTLSRESEFSRLLKIEAEWTQSYFSFEVNYIFIYLISEVTINSAVSMNYKLRQWPTWSHLLYFTTLPLQSSTCFEHYMLIIRRLNWIDAASDIVTLIQCPSGAPDGRWLRGWYQMLHQCNSASWWWACIARNM